MKKKIVYISGADSFDANEVRAAFDEVRGTLGLDSDTVLFGVPVDDLIAMDAVDADADFGDSVKEDEIALENMPKPMPKEKNTAHAKKKNTESTVVPIMSVLGEDSDDADETVAIEPTGSVDTGDIDKMLDDDMPVAEHEKTLEELLETMAPLREDVQMESVTNVPESIEIEDSIGEADATLASLATEFVDVQDKVPTFEKNSERGKISKLKSILPFTKKKRDDTGIMGDLFGWAGVAANDEEFSIPGFFTNVASKK